MTMNDIVVVPLRVTKETRRLWRVRAGMEDKSVQKWILDKLVKQEEETESQPCARKRAGL